MLEVKVAKDYYSREDVQHALLQVGKDREVVGVFKNGGFGQRPNVILYPQDIVTMVKEGVQEFHSSLERWSNPMSLRADNYQGLRTGWDLILDLDCKDFQHAKLAAGLVYRKLEEHGLKSISIKYTGGKGFHIGIPWESMPPKLNFKSTADMFPDIARQMGLYIKEKIRAELEKGLLKLNNPEQLAEISGKELGLIMTDDGIDPFRIVDIDPILISSRHLFRMPYSLNRNTGYVSLPLNIRDLDEFEKIHATPKGLRVRKMFLQPGEPGEAATLISETADWWEIYKKKVERMTERRVRSGARVPEDVFPPCIKNISMGLSDGRKRSLHILSSFIRSCNWNWSDTEKFIYQWNLKNNPPLNENLIRGHIRYHKARNKKIPTYGCKHQDYTAIGACKPDHICGGAAKTIKNPSAYPFRKIENTEKYKKLTEKSKKRKGPSEPPAGSGMYAGT